MRFFLTVVLAAILLFVLYVVVGGIVDGYFGGNMVPDDAVPDSWAAPDSWSEWRDIFIVLMGFWWALAGLIMCVLLVALVFLVITVRRLLKENVAPAVDSLKDTLDNVKGTSEFVSETAVAPIVRVYSVVRGVRGGVSTVSNLPNRIRNRKKDKS